MPQPERSPEAKSLPANPPEAITGDKHKGETREKLAKAAHVGVGAAQEFINVKNTAGAQIA